MRIKAFFFFLAMIVFFSNSYSDTIKADSDEVVVDLNTNTLTAEKGISVKSDSVSGLFYKLERDPKTEIIKFSESALVNLEQSTGNIKIETERGTLDRLKEKGEFYNNFAYINVAKTTGAEAPNDKVYFGSPYVKYEDEKISYQDGWITTDFRIVNFPDSPKKAGYHIFSKNADIEPDKQITLYNSNLFIKERNIFPFNIPWFRANIRKNSKVPLFPTFKSSDDYGFETSWGFLYGNRKDKYRGGIAPKFSDKMGLLIGRWENWYSSDLGETKLDIDDLLIYSKAKKSSNNNIGQLSEYEKSHKRYRFSFSQEYSGEKGYFDLKAINSTRSMVGKLSDIMQKMDDNNIYKTLGIDRYKYDKNIGFYTLSADLKNLGEDKDLNLKADLSLVSDKKGYGLIVYDSIDDIGYGSNIDHDLYSKLYAVKDNEKYKLSAGYKYLYDLDPGSTSLDLQSKDEQVAVDYLHRESGLELKYDKRIGNDYRRFSLWEKDIKTTLRQKNILGIDMNYVPTTIVKYEKNDHEKINGILGKYSLGAYTFKPKLSYEDNEKKLDLSKDKYRVSMLGDSRISDYNRFENIIYEEKIEKRIDLDLSNEKEIYGFGIGEAKEKIWDRTGLFDGSYRDYKNESKFFELTLGRKNIESSFGKFNILSSFRQDSYKNSSDKTNALNLKLGHEISFSKNLNNNLSLEFQNFKFSGDVKREEQRHINKVNYIKIEDEIKFKTKNLDTVFTTSYKEARDSYGKKALNSRIFLNEIAFKTKYDEEFKLFFDEDRRYTSKTLSGTNLNDLSKRNYGFNYSKKNHSFSFSNLDMKFNVRDFVSPIEAEEKINENRFTYSYKRENDKITLSYAQGKDKVESSAGGRLNKKNTDYSVLYNTFNQDREQDFYFSFSENDYGTLNESSSIRNTDVYRFSYEYRDKRFEKEELIKYATLEYEKPKDEISIEDVETIKNILERSQKFNRQFELTRISDETFKIGNYKKAFKFYITMEKNDKRYSKTGDLMKSLSKLEGGLSYTYNRLGVGYTFIEKSDWKRSSGSYEWKKNSREHELSVYAKIGKPSQGWKLKTYAKFYENLADKASATANRKKSLDGIGIEIGKEMGFYEWALSFENKYSATTKNYEWRAGLHFTLLTFPNDSIFGIGAKDSGSGSTKPDGYLLDRPSPLNSKK